MGLEDLELCKKLVQNDLLQQGPNPVFIDEEIFTSIFSEAQEILNDASLSGFLLHYNLKLSLDNYLKVFPPTASRRTRLCSLRYMGGSYGYHLIYMALKLDNGKEKHSDAIAALEVKGIYKFTVIK